MVCNINANFSWKNRNIFVTLFDLILGYPARLFPLLSSRFPTLGKNRGQAKKKLVNLVFISDDTILHTFQNLADYQPGVSS